MYNTVLDCLVCIENALNDNRLSFIKHCFIFGSVAKHRIHEDSDIDVLLIGTEHKNISIISLISEILDTYNTTDKELDIKYYNIDRFRCLRSSNLFLKNISKDAIKLEDIKNELLRFCS